MWETQRHRGQLGRCFGPWLCSYKPQAAGRERLGVASPTSGVLSRYSGPLYLTSGHARPAKGGGRALLLPSADGCSGYSRKVLVLTQGTHARATLGAHTGYSGCRRRSCFRPPSRSAGLGLDRRGGTAFGHAAAQICSVGTRNGVITVPVMALLRADPGNSERNGIVSTHSRLGPLIRQRGNRRLDIGISVCRFRKPERRTAEGRQVGDPYLPTRSASAYWLHVDAGRQLGQVWSHPFQPKPAHRRHFHPAGALCARESVYPACGSGANADLRMSALWHGGQLPQLLPDTAFVPRPTRSSMSRSGVRDPPGWST